MGYIRWCAYAPCGKVMIVRKSRLERTKYCSKDCQSKAKIGKSCSPETQFKPGSVPPTLASVGTDGIDGTSEAAGAIGDLKVKETASSKGYDFDSYLEHNDSFRFFSDCGGLLITGPTGTNVADICVYLK